jgi:AraC-like DNA-binding protein
MVCDRCKTTVANALKNHGIVYEQLNLGEVEISGQLAEHQLLNFKEEIEGHGFELIEDKTSRIISRIKSAVVGFIHYRDGTKGNFSDFLEERLHKEYSSLSHLFSSVEGLTIERYLILQKIERIKELLVYDEMSLQQIADALGYSSVPHLSNQFKKITGLSPTHFRKIGAGKRKSLDKV